MTAGGEIGMIVHDALGLMVMGLAGAIGSLIQPALNAALRRAATRIDLP